MKATKRTSKPRVLDVNRYDVTDALNSEAPGQRWIGMIVGRLYRVRVVGTKVITEGFYSGDEWKDFSTGDVRERLLEHALLASGPPKQRDPCQECDGLGYVDGDACSECDRPINKTCTACGGSGRATPKRQRANRATASK